MSQETQNRVTLQQSTPDIEAEVDRLLAGRTRDIRLSPKLTHLFRLRSWSQTAKIIRAWMVWVVLLDVVTLAVNAALLPGPVTASMILPAAALPPAALATALVFIRPRGRTVEGIALLSGLSWILLSVALVGIHAGGEFVERHLTIMLFVAVTAIIIFPIPLAWSIAVAAFALALNLALQLGNAEVQPGSALAGSLFYASGLAASLVARQTANILAYKTFLLELRNRSNVIALTDANTRLERLARTDPLTGIPNRRWMREALNQTWRDDSNSKQGIAILMCDVDHFKRLNDSLGHAEGDRCLVKIAGIIQSSLRAQHDDVARYGGEEFMVLLRTVDTDKAIEIAERIRKRVEAACLPNPGSSAGPFTTLSIGVAVTNAPAQTSDMLQRQADAALYRAKADGRNRIVVAMASPPTSDNAL